MIPGVIFAGGWIVGALLWAYQGTVPAFQAFGITAVVTWWLRQEQLSRQPAGTSRCRGDTASSARPRAVTRYLWPVTSDKGQVTSNK